MQDSFLCKNDGSTINDFIMHILSHHRGFHFTYVITYLIKTLKYVPCTNFCFEGSTKFVLLCVKAWQNIHCVQSVYLSFLPKSDHKYL